MAMASHCRNSTPFLAEAVYHQALSDLGLSHILLMMHVSLGLWKCVWSTATRWSLPVLDKHHRTSSTASASVHRLVCFSGLREEIVSELHLAMMKRMCFHTLWWVHFSLFFLFFLYIIGSYFVSCWQRLVLSVYYINASCSCCCHILMIVRSAPNGGCAWCTLKTIKMFQF